MCMYNDEYALYGTHQCNVLKLYCHDHYFSEIIMLLHESYRFLREILDIVHNLP